MSSGNYVVAAGDSFVQLIDRFLYLYDGKRYLNEEDLKRVITNTIDKYLYSFGAEMNYKTKKIPKNRLKRFIQKTNEIHRAKYMDSCEIYWDSGGYQVSNGALHPKYMKDFIQMYYGAVKNHTDIYDHAFLMDLPPGPGTKDFFSSNKQIEEINRYSYEMASNMYTEEEKKKLIFVYHFRSPALYDTWTKFMFEDGLADGYEYFGTGGIVANIKSDILNPLVSYTLPLSCILRYAIDRNMKKFNFHVLGGANFIDVFYHKLMTLHIKEHHDIDVNITYDSTGLFKGISVARYVYTINNLGNMVKMEYGSDKLHLRFDEGGTIEDKLYEHVNNISRKYNIKQIDRNITPVYKNGRISMCMNIYLMMYLLDIYRVIEDMSELQCAEVYKFYKSGEHSEFIKQCTEIIKRHNYGKVSTKMKSKCNSLIKSMKMLENPDLDYNKHMVEKYMDSESLGSKGHDEILTW